MEELIKLLKNSNLKLVEKETGIPYDRMYKWIKGKSTPKTLDYSTLLNYFNSATSIDGKTSKSVENTLGNENITENNLAIVKDENEVIANINQSAKKEVKQGLKFSDSGQSGDFYKALPKPVSEAEPLHLSASSKFWDSDNPKFEELPDGTLRMRIPVIPYKAFAAGYLIGHSDPDYFEDLEYTTIEVLKKHQGYYLAFEIQGDSMTTLEPANFRQSIFDGVKVVGRELPRQQWRSKLHTHKWDFWIIVHKELGIMIKQIIKHDVENGIITIHSLNPDKSTYPDMDLKLDDIEQIFNMVKKIDE